MPEAVFDTRACARRLEEAGVAAAEAQAGALRAALDESAGGAIASGGVGERGGPDHRPVRRATGIRRVRHRPGPRGRRRPCGRPRMALGSGAAR